MSLKNSLKAAPDNVAFRSQESLLACTGALCLRARRHLSLEIAVVLSCIIFQNLFEHTLNVLYRNWFVSHGHDEIVTVRYLQFVSDLTLSWCGKYENLFPVFLLIEFLHVFNGLIKSGAQ